MKQAIEIIKKEIANRNIALESIWKDYIGPETKQVSDELKSLKKALNCLEVEHLSRCPDCDVRYVHANINSYYCPKCYKQFNNI